jgi:ribonuclease HII
MKKSVDGLKKLPNFLFLDGRHTITGLDVKQEAVIKGDSKILSVAAASIIAKVARDEIMNEWHTKHPEYGFDKHKGYATKQHKAAIEKFGLLSIHRKTFCS